MAQLSRHLNPYLGNEGKQVLRDAYDSLSLFASVFVGFFVSNMMNDVYLQEELLMGIAMVIFSMTFTRRLFQRTTLQKFGWWALEGMSKSMGVICGAYFEMSIDFLKVSLVWGVIIVVMTFALLLSCTLDIRMLQRKIMHPETDHLLGHEKLIGVLIRRISRGLNSRPR